MKFRHLYMAFPSAQAGGGDANWANVVLLAVDENAADTSTTFDDASTSNKTITANGDAAWDSGVQLNGRNTCLVGDAEGNYLSLATSADFGFGTGDYTIEIYVRPTSDLYMNILNVYSGTEGFPTLGRTAVGGTGVAFLYYNGSDVITGAAGNIPTNSWTHIAVSRVSGTTRMFCGGTQVGSNWSDANNYGASRVVNIGSWAGLGDYFLGNYAGVRITKGVGRYTGSFTPPTLPYPTS